MELNAHKEIAKERRNKIGSASFDYDYESATGLEVKVDLRPGSKFHDKLVEKALEMAHASQEGQGDFFSDCKKMDWTLTGYVTPEDANPNGNPKNRQRNIVVPMTYEFREYFRAAWKGTFVKDPMFSYRPFPGPRALINAAIMEYRIQRQTEWFKTGLQAIKVVNSAFTYGVGTGTTCWQRKRENRPVNREVTLTAINIAKAMGVEVPMSAVNSMIRDMEEVDVYEGTELVPWDIYSTMRDPNVSSDDMQRGQFIGNRRRTSADEMLSIERDKSQRRFNGQYVKALAEENGATSSCFGENKSGRSERFKTSADYVEGGGGALQPVDVLYFEFKAIPKDLGTGDETHPVIYQLEVAADSIVTAFGPTDVMDNEFRVVQTAPNTDGFDFIPISQLFVTYGIQQFNDTMARVTEALAVKNVNGGWTLFNHNVANWDDVNNPEPAKLIRYANPFVTPEQAKIAIQQFPSMDMRDSHMRHMSYFDEVARRGNGLQEVMSDLPERPTQLGVKAATGGKASRLDMIMWIIGEQMMTPLGWKKAQNQVQYGSMPIQMEFIGNLAKQINDNIGGDPAVLAEIMAMYMEDGSINPLALTLDFEMRPYTGASGQNDDTAAMGSFLQAGMQSPEVLAEIQEEVGFGGLARDYVRKMGFESVSEYKKAGNKMPQMVMAPDEVVQANIASGNRVPVGG